MNSLANWASEVWSFIAGLVTGVGGSLLTLRIKRLKSKNNGNTVDQSNARAKGDIAGRDHITRG